MSNLSKLITSEAITEPNNQSLLIILFNVTERNSRTSSLVVEIGSTNISCVYIQWLHLLVHIKPQEGLITQRPPMEDPVVVN